MGVNKVDEFRRKEIAFSTDLKHLFSDLVRMSTKNVIDFFPVQSVFVLSNIVSTAWTRVRDDQATISVIRDQATAAPAAQHAN